MKTQHDSETLAEGQQVITATAFIWQEFEGVKMVFLPKRADTKKFLPGVWELPGGHIEYGEDIKIGLVREIKEEFEMDIEIGEVIDVFTYVNDVKKSHSIEVVYFAQFTGSSECIKIHPEDHSTYKWFSANEYEEIVYPSRVGDDLEALVIRKAFARLGAL